MSKDKTSGSKKSGTVEWLLRGSLTKIGDIFDQLTGRNWKPSSSLATSELIEKLKALINAKSRDLGKSGVFVPHDLKLKVQWDKFSLDSEESIRRLEVQLLTAVIDHINDNRFHTYAPLKLQVKPDYFTEGVSIVASFDKFADEADDAGDAVINLSFSKPQDAGISPVPPIEEKPEIEKLRVKEIVRAMFVVQGKNKEIKLEFGAGERLNIGRIKENSLIIEDASVSKIHSTLFINNEKKLMVADVGSTNGTFINGNRIAYGKSFEVKNGDKVKFGNVEVKFDYNPQQVNNQPESEKITEQLNIASDNSPELLETLRLSKEETLPPTVSEHKPALEMHEKASPKPHITLKPLGKSMAEKVHPVTFSNDPTLTDLRVKPEIESNTEEALEDKTNQGIVLDLGENK